MIEGVILGSLTGLVWLHITMAILIKELDFYFIFYTSNTLFNPVNFYLLNVENDNKKPNNL